MQIPSKISKKWPKNIIYATNILACVPNLARNLAKCKQFLNKNQCYNRYTKVHKGTQRDLNFKTIKMGKIVKK